MDLTLARQSELQLAMEQMEAHAIGQLQWRTALCWNALEWRTARINQRAQQKDTLWNCWPFTLRRARGFQATELFEMEGD